MERNPNSDRKLAKEVTKIIAASAAAPVALIPAVVLAQEQPAQVQECQIKVEGYNPNTENQISIGRTIPCSILERKVYQMGTYLPLDPAQEQKRSNEEVLIAGGIILVPLLAALAYMIKMED